MDNLGKMREYVGYACETLLGDDVNTLEVLIPELQATISGKVTPSLKKDTRTVDVENSAMGGKKSAVVNLVNTVKCSYFGRGLNSLPPNIHHGEQVKVISYGNSSVFYWCPIGRDDDLRTTERLRIRIANKTKQKPKITDDTSYFFEMDSRKGKRKVKIATSKGTGEKVSYNILLDLEKSTLSVIDSVGNGLNLDSLMEVWKMNTLSGSHVTLNKGKASVVAPVSVDVSAPMANVTAPSINLKGNIAAIGNVDVVGNLTVSGNTTTGGTSHAAGRSGASI